MTSSYRVPSPRRHFAIAFVALASLYFWGPGIAVAQRKRPATTSTKKQTTEPTKKPAAAPTATNTPTTPKNEVAEMPKLAPPTADVSNKLAENLRRYLPRTMTAMRARFGDVHVTVVGDSIACNWQPDEEHRYRTETAWHGLLLKRLANTFIYTGGVQYEGPIVSNAKKRRQQKKQEDESLGLPGDVALPMLPLTARTQGPAIQVQMLARESGMAPQAAQWLTTSAFDLAPTLVVLEYGFSDALAGISPDHFRAQIQDAVNYCKAKDVDIILASPPLTVGEDMRYRLGQVRPYSAVLGDIAKKEDLLYVDWGASQAEFAFDDTLALQSVEESLLSYIKSSYPLEASYLEVGPSPEAHRDYLDAVWKALAEPPAVPAASFPMFSGKLLPPPTPEATWTVEVELTSAAPGDKLFRYVLLSADRNLTPVATPPDATYAPPTGEVKLTAKQTLRFAYQPSKSVVRNVYRKDLPFSTGRSNLSLLAIHEGRSSFVDVPLSLAPAGLQLGVARYEGAAESISIPINILPTAGVVGPAKLLVSWLETVQTVDVVLTDKPQSVPVTLALPIPGSPQVHFKKELRVELQAATGRSSLVKELECTRHFGLEKKYVLAPATEMTSSQAAWDYKPDPLGPALTVLADAAGLYYVLDLPPHEGSRGNDEVSAQIDFTMDARGPNERGKLGFVDPIEMELPWEDGRFEVKKPRNAVFGNGYDRELERKWFLASVSTLPSGRRQVRLSIPRNYFYLHQWSLGKSGQNSLGLNVSVWISDVDSSSGKTTFNNNRRYCLVDPGLSKNDAIGLAVLELDAASAAKWSVVVY
jgi:hypothetical protein